MSESREDQFRILLPPNDKTIEMENGHIRSDIRTSCPIYELSYMCRS
jgi:hypothetical protein